MQFHLRTNLFGVKPYIALIGYVLQFLYLSVEAKAEAQTSGNTYKQPAARSEPLTRMYRQSVPATASSPNYSSYSTAEEEEDVIIKILPLPIPISVPVPAPVHVAVPSVPPFYQQSPSFNNYYNPLPSLNLFGAGPRMNKREVLDETQQQLRTKRAADADHSSIISANNLVPSVAHHSSTTHSHLSRHLTRQHPNSVFLTTQGTPQILTPTNIRQQPTPLQQQTQPISFASSNEQLALPSNPQIITLPAPQNKLPIPFQQNNLPNQIPHHPVSGGMSYRYLHPNTILGDDPVKATFISAHSNPLQHLLSAPYLKHIKETNGEDLPTLEEIKELLERSSFGLSGFQEEDEDNEDQK